MSLLGKSERSIVYQPINCKVVLAPYPDFDVHSVQEGAALLDGHEVQAGLCSRTEGPHGGYVAFYALTLACSLLGACDALLQPFLLLLDEGHALA